MPPTPLLRPRDIVRALERLGWQVARQRGSHNILTSRATLRPSRFPITRKWLGGPFAACSLVRG